MAFMNKFSISENQNTPDDFPKILYKYRRWDDLYHKRILENNELYLSSPKHFNDPFDCRIPEDYYLLNTTDLKNEYIEKILTEQPNNSEYEINELKDKQNYIRIYNYLNSDISKVQKEMSERWFKLQDLHFGILSMSTIWDNILMWGHYANCHKGFCIGLYEKNLRESNAFGRGGIVNYQNEFPKINPLDDIIEKSFTQTHFKALNWQYESEFRLTKTIFPEVPTETDRIVNFKDDTIAEIILGLNISKDDEQTIIEIARKRKIKIYKTYKKVLEFKLDRYEIK